MHLYHILINWSQKFWVIYVQYRFIYEQCAKQKSSLGLTAQIREQMSGPDLHVFTLKFLALKKLVFPP